MRTDLTFSMIKPDAVSKGAESEIVRMIHMAGFRIIGMKVTQLTKDRAEEFYAIHADKPFFDKLIRFMSSGTIFALAIQKDNAVEDYRTLIGDTDPKLADSGTIRKLYGTDIAKNAVHGADSDENAKREILFFFPELVNKY